MEVKIQLLGARDLTALIQLIELFEVAFEMEEFHRPGDKHLQKLLEAENLYFMVAMKEEKVVGGLRAYLLPSIYSVSPEMYLYDIAVHESCQRQGIGAQLIDALKAHAAGLGCSVVFVQADVEDTHALEFYKATGGRQAEVRHYTYVLK